MWWIEVKRFIKAEIKRDSRRGNMGRGIRFGVQTPLLDLAGTLGKFPSLREPQPLHHRNSTLPWRMDVRIKLIHGKAFHKLEYAMQTPVIFLNSIFLTSKSLWEKKFCNFYKMREFWCSILSLSRASSTVPKLPDNMLIPICFPKSRQGLLNLIKASSSPKTDHSLFNCISFHVEGVLFTDFISWSCWCRCRDSRQR